MPCIQAPCPCWDLEELESLSFPPYLWEGCEVHPPANQHYFAFAHEAGYTRLITNSDQWGISRCAISFGIPPNRANRFMYITAEEFETCKAQMIQAGIERGFTCWD